jgi:hypothetical protein
MTTISDDGTFTRLVNPSLDYQLAAFDRAQYIVGNFVWDLPKGSKLVGGSKAAGLFLDHWILSGVTTLASGQPTDVGLTISGQDSGARLLGTPTSGNLSGNQMRFLLNGDPQNRRDHQHVGPGSSGARQYRPLPAHVPAQPLDREPGSFGV